MVLKSPKTAGNAVRSLHRIKSLPKFSNNAVTSNLIEVKKSDAKIKVDPVSDEILNLKNNRKSLQRTQCLSKLMNASCSDFEDNKSKPSAQVTQNTAEGKYDSEENIALVNNKNLRNDNIKRQPKTKISDLKKGLTRTELEAKRKTEIHEDEKKAKINEDEWKAKVHDLLYNFEIRNNVNRTNEETKAKHSLDSYTQFGPRNWQSHWKEFEADIKKDVDSVETLLETNDPESVVDCALFVLKKLNTYSASLKQKYPYRARVCYCLGKSYLASENYQASFKCSMELLRMGDILKDGKIVYSGYSVACKTYTKLRDYGKAAELWQKMISMEDNLRDRAKLYHAIGKWHFILCEWEIAKTFGEVCLQTAVEAASNTWCMMASVLIGKSALKLNKIREALDALCTARHYKSLQVKRNGANCAKRDKNTKFT